MEKEVEMERMGYTILDLVNKIVSDIEKPLKKKKPDVKTALSIIDWYNKKTIELREIWQKEDERKSEVVTKKIYTYKCLYQCGFTTSSIREIDTHLTKEHGHPDPKRDYSHP